MKSALRDSHLKQPCLIIVMGVSGCGKTTVAQKLAELNVLEFMEADDFHSTSAVEKMSNGMALNDEDREPWIDSMCRYLSTRAKNNISCCLAYSGLRRAHRKRFLEIGFEVFFIHLTANKEIILNHLEKRSEHFMGSALLESQYNDLQPAAFEEPIYDVQIQESIESTVMSAQKILLKNIFNDEI